MTYLILSLDGGGVRGVLTARLLQRLEEAHPFLSQVKLFAGTSTGGLLALALASARAPGDLVDFYRERGPQIFAHRDILDRLVWRLDELVRANYALEPLKTAIESVVGAATLGDLERKVLVAAFDLDNEAAPPRRHWKPKFLHNYASPGNDSAVSVVDAALRTAAAPTFFPSHQGFVDGGVVANNPSACALAQAVSESIAMGEVCLLSLGTGFNPRYVAGGDWGYVKWARHLLRMIFDGTPGVADFQCKQFLNDRYHRLDPPLPEVIELDDAAKIDQLVDIATSVVLDETLVWLNANVPVV